MTCNATTPICTASYDDDRIQLFLGDCRELIPDLPRPALVLTDPPYGMSYYPRRGGRGSKLWKNELIAGDDQPFDPAHLLALGRCALWGANWYADKLPRSGGWLVWDKTPRGRKEGFYASDAELAWTNCCSSVRKFSLQWNGTTRNGEPYLHPTQKPVALMRWVVEQFTSEGDLVLDPYMGSGPVAQACRELNRRYIGIEISDDHFRAAQTRLAQTSFL
jgi:site-specific DNA-methyltransferase (adenine-specific)/modification methylase